jgi:hypothetical protein
LISRSQLTRPTSVVYGEGVADEEDGAAMALAGAGAGEALAQAKLRRTVAASGWESRRGMERRRGDTRSRRRTAAMSRGAWLGPRLDAKFSPKFYYAKKKDSLSHQNTGTCMEY